MATLGSAGPELPGHGCCREWRQAASWVVVGRMRGGERCRRTISGGSMRGRHVTQQMVKAWQWQVDNTSLPAMTAGGRAMVPTLGAALQQQIRHRSLPPPLLPMPAARWRSALASSDFLNPFVRFDLRADSNDPHIVWKLLRRRIR